MEHVHQVVVIEIEWLFLGWSWSNIMLYRTASHRLCTLTRKTQVTIFSVVLEKVDPQLFSQIHIKHFLKSICYWSFHCSPLPAWSLHKVLHVLCKEPLNCSNIIPLEIFSLKVSFLVAIIWPKGILKLKAISIRKMFFYKNLAILWA